VTYRAIAAVIGISWPGVRQVEKRALKKLRRACARAGISAADIIERRQGALAAIQRDEEDPRRVRLRDESRPRRRRSKDRE
jgi:Sigma-70, region 4